MAWPPPLNSNVQLPEAMWASNLNWRVRPGPMELMPSVASWRVPFASTMTACKPPMGMEDSLTTSTTIWMMSSSSSSISILTDVKWAFKEPARALWSSLTWAHRLLLNGGITSMACPSGLLSAQSQTCLGGQRPVHSSDRVVLAVNGRPILRLGGPGAVGVA